MSTPDCLTGIHAYWTAPKLHNARKQGWSESDLQFVPALEPQDLITMILAVFAWRAFHGPMVLFADARILDFLDRRGLLDMYDSVRSAEIEGIDQRRYDPDVYFSLPKLIALQAIPVPVAVLDVDLFLRAPLPEVGPRAFVFAHYESLNRHVYPMLSDLPKPAGVALPGWEDSVPACNMAIGGFGNQPHVDEFTSLALAYAADNGAELGLHPVARIAFAEQRLCAYTAARHGVTLRPVTESVWDTEVNEWTQGPPERLFHHTWHHKRYLDRQLAQDRLCVRLAGELIRAFPESADLLERDPKLAGYAQAALRAPAPTG